MCGNRLTRLEGLCIHRAHRNWRLRLCYVEELQYSNWRLCLCYVEELQYHNWRLCLCLCYVEELQYRNWGLCLCYVEELQCNPCTDAVAEAEEPEGERHDKRSEQLQVSSLGRFLSLGRVGEFLLGHTAEIAGQTSRKPGSFVADESTLGCIEMGEGCTERLGVRKVVEPEVGVVVDPWLCNLAEIGRGRWFEL